MHDGHVSAGREIDSADVPDWVASELLSPQRTRPILAITTRHGTPLVNVPALARAVAGAADVVLLATGPATTELASLLPEKLDVFGGACRVWYPGLTSSSDPYDPPLVWVRPDQPRQAERRIAELLGVTLPDEEGSPLPIGADVTA